MVIQAQPLHRMFTHRLYLLLSHWLCSLITHQELCFAHGFFQLSSLSVTSSVRITSAILNSVHKQYCKSHSSNLAFCTSARSCLRGQSLLEVVGRVPDPFVWYSTIGIGEILLFPVLRTWPYVWRLTNVWIAILCEWVLILAWFLNFVPKSEILNYPFICLLEGSTNWQRKSLIGLAVYFKIIPLTLYFWISPLFFHALNCDWEMNLNSSDVPI